MNVSRKKGPLYLQIKNILKDRILHGVYKVNSLIPSEPQLEEEFNVSKITVRNAINALVQEGFLEKRSGKGTKVIRNTVTSKLYKGKRFTELLVDEGHALSKKWLKAEAIATAKDTPLYHLFGAQCLRIDRLYLLDERPYIHYTHFLSMHIDMTEASELGGQSLYDFIEEQGITLENFRDEFAVAKAPSHVEKALGLDKSIALLKRIRYSYNDVGTPIEYSEGYYNTELQHYVVNYDV
ncbi:GntR family transcriptional regulator [Pullulanibacillus camelliae]|nr:GntR family transcriptional regulator [Pullulanibacillus camelliae]